MIKEIAGFFSQSVKDGNSLTFVGWYFDDITDLRQLNYTISGILVFAHSVFKESTTAANAIQILSVFQTDNVKKFINNLNPDTLTDANIILVRQQDNAKEREHEYKKLKVVL